MLLKQKDQVTPKATERVGVEDFDLLNLVGKVTKEIFSSHHSSGIFRKSYASQEKRHRKDLCNESFGQKTYSWPQWSGTHSCWKKYLDGNISFIWAFLIFHFRNCTILSLWICTTVFRQTTSYISSSIM